MGVTLIMSLRVDLRARTMIRALVGHDIMINESFLQEDITVLILYATNNRASKEVRQKLIELQGERNESTIIISNFSIPLSVIGRSSRQKINKDLVALNSTINQLNLIDIYRLYQQQLNIHFPQVHLEHLPS